MGNKPEHDDANPREVKPCTVCGSVDYEWGRLASDYLVLFKRPGALGKSIEMRARRCLGCGNVQLFTQE